MGSMWVGDVKLHCSVFVDVLICVMSYCCFVSVPRATSEPQGKREKRTKTDGKDSCQIHSLSFILLFVFFDTNIIQKSEEERWGVTTLTPHLTPFSRRYARRRGAAKGTPYSLRITT